jgi:hypothetical protein
MPSGRMTELDEDPNEERREVGRGRKGTHLSGRGTLRTVVVQGFVGM